MRGARLPGAVWLAAGGTKLRWSAMRAVGRGNIAVAWTAFVLAIASPALARGGAVERTATATAGPTAHTLSAADRARALAHWTPERMAAARPVPLGRLHVGAPPQPIVARRSHPLLSVPARGPARRSNLASESGPQRTYLTAPQGTDTGNPGQLPNYLIGRVFLTIGGQDAACSGSIVGAPNASTVLTAGHCVFDDDSGAFVSNVIFVPGYRDPDGDDGPQDPQAPFGVWAVSSMATTDGWQFDDESGVDVGILTLAQPGGRRIEDALGALGVGFGFDYQQTYTEWGYPADAPYDGGQLFRTTSEFQGSDPSAIPPAIGIDSDFTGGASGGPFTDPDLRVLSVTSYSLDGDPGVLYGPHFEDDAFLLYCDRAGLRVLSVIRNRRRGTASATVDTPCDGGLFASGRGLRQTFVETPGDGGTVALPLSASGSSARKLRRHGHVTLHPSVSYLDPIGALGASQSLTVTLSRRR